MTLSYSFIYYSQYGLWTNPTNVVWELVINSESQALA